MSRLSIVLAVAIASCATTASADPPVPAAVKPVGAVSPGPGTAPSRDPLEIGFRFATAIEADPNDQAMAQEKIVDDLIAARRLEDASRWGDRIKGWRRGTASADIARAWALAGRADRARELLQRADEVRRSTSDWGVQRIGAHTAQALAALGEVDKTTAITTELTRDDPRQYTGRAAATLATGLAQKGDFAGALARLDALEEEKDFDITWWRTTGYLDLARRKDVTAAQRRQAMDKARASADGISGWKRGEALLDISREWSSQGGAEKAREALDSAEKVIAALPATQPDKGELMSEVAKGWVDAGDRDRARRLLKRADSETSSAPLIDRPEALARIGGAYWKLGDRSASSDLLDRALTSAEGLVNARPRALAVVEICRSMALDSVALDNASRGRLDALFAGLRDPW